MTSSTLSQRIGQFYDASSTLWEKVWGEHMHHGYYGPTGEVRCDRTHPDSTLRHRAQIQLIEELLDWGEVHSATQILDVGCGIGGSTLYLAQKFQAAAVGITLSPVQAQRAQERAQEQGIPPGSTLNLDNGPGSPAVDTAQVSFQVTDALNTPFPDNYFDLIWSLESGEHMPDKQQFLAECYRQLKPGGTLLMATWCHRTTTSLAGPLTAAEQQQLSEIYRVYCLPYVISLPEYEALATDIGFRKMRSADWSAAVEPFWQDVIISALNPTTLTQILTAGGATLEGALALGLMSSGFQNGLIRYGLLVGQK